MNFLNFFHHGKKENMTKYPTDEAAELFSVFLDARGFQMEKPSLELAWSAFKMFCTKYQFECNDDAILWEVGHYCRLDNGERAFRWHLVRQFICGQGEDEDIVQLCFDIDFPAGMAEGVQAEIWSYDYSGNLNAFFAAVESHGGFAAAQNPRHAVVYLDLV